MGKFFGNYSRTLDEKNRLQIPSKLLKDLPEKFYVLKGFEGCLSVYLEEDFNSLMEELSALSYREPAKRAYVRLTLSSVNELEVDSHGRISISKELIDRYNIGKEVILLGALDHFEIWDKDSYNAYEDKFSSEYEEIAKALDEREK